MKQFFNVITPNKLLSYVHQFSCVKSETISIDQSLGRFLAEDIIAPENIPPFKRSTMDGYAVNAASTFGASESNPTLLFIKESIQMGDIPNHIIELQEASKIATGGMLPDGADSVVMVEYTDLIDEATIEVYKSVAPLQHVIDVGEDISKNSIQCKKGQKIRPQDLGSFAALGIPKIQVYKKPIVGIISTGDEIVSLDQTPGLAQIRDINRYSLSAQVSQNGGKPVFIGNIPDNFNALRSAFEQAINTCDMIMISGGSSVGMRDYTIEVIQSFKHASLIAHGVSIQPGKPTILAYLNNIPLWGLPGHVASAMIVFHILVRPFLRHIAGEINPPFYTQPTIKARLSRNIASTHGREEYIRVKLEKEISNITAVPVQGKSGLIRTMVQADGLIVIPENSEGLEQGVIVDVLLI
ncbi:molybdopterin biosynthesis protein MoeA [Candidatus Magnetomorum sp. HK-1]|nr:molybdopterin biosynthesis protein MoeA [Candidatus Magnetomorum sp. HK-1]